MTIQDLTDRGAKLVRANGIEIAYVEAGDGPPLVLLHGAFVSTGPAWAGNPIAYVPHMETLAKHFRVVAPDTRGSGATVHPGGTVSYSLLADDLAALVDALGLERPALMGFSDGAAIATVAAIRHPEAVGALALHAGYDVFVPNAPIFEMGRTLFGGSPEATQADADAAERALGAIPPMAAMLERTKADYDGAQGAGHWREYLRIFFDRATHSPGYTVDDFRSIAAPTLILTGDRDHFCSVEEAATAYRNLPAGELAVLPNTGHEITPGVIDASVEFLVRHLGA
ncbi:MAG TPA: alpha/beta hydrolase [Acidimicrobiales bacterium]|nr:alpha/beta hydrolase [Acidimicrobiales bacterium]